VGYQDRANAGKVILNTGNSKGFERLIAETLVRNGYTLFATVLKVITVTDALNYSLGAKSMKRFAFSLLATAIAMATLSPIAIAASNFDQMRRDNLDKDAVDFDQARRESLKESTRLDDLRRDNLDKNAADFDQTRCENLDLDLTQ
jgi:hypothetical protein